MTLYPEQQRALDYLRRKGTEAPWSEIRGRLGASTAAFEEAIAAVPDEVAQRRPGPGRWSVLEVVDHLLVSHRRAFEELDALLAGHRPTGGPIPPSLQSADPEAQPWPALQAVLAELHRRLLARLDGLDGLDPGTVAGEPDGAVTAPVAMVVRVERDGVTEPITWVAELDAKAYALGLHAHTLEHRDQVERTLARVAPPAATGAASP
jgi:hypothetical protein